jgi:nucleoid-associated protein YgaU
MRPRANSIPVPRSSSPASRVVIQPGDTLWNLSRQHLGRGTRWLELLAANPGLDDPTRLVPGTQLVLPARTVTHRRSAQTITVQHGDSLSKIAHATYGHASYWPCLASANSSIANPNQLHIGQLLVLPASCTP